MAPTQSYKLPTHTDRGILIIYAEYYQYARLLENVDGIGDGPLKGSRFITNSDLVPLHKRGRK